MYGLWLWLMTLSFVEMGSGWKINSFGFQGLSPPYFTSKVVCTTSSKSVLHKRGKSCTPLQILFFLTWKERKTKIGQSYLTVFWQWSQEVVVLSRRFFMSCYRFSEGFCKDHLMVYFHFKRLFESLCTITSYMVA